MRNLKQLSNCCALFLLLLTGATAGESQPLDLVSASLGKGITRADTSGHEVLRVSVPAEAASHTLAILELDNPPITSSAYALMGEVRFAGLGTGSYLETWNHLGADAQSREIDQSFFSRTLGPSGPVGVLEGDSDWRIFQLPAYINDGSGRKPLKLSFNVYPAAGSKGWVEVRDLRIIDLSAPASANPFLSGGMRQSLLLATGGLLGVLIALSIMMAVRSRRHREMRRIQAADL